MWTKPSTERGFISVTHSVLPSKFCLEMYFLTKTLTQLQEKWGPVCFYCTLWERGPVGLELICGPSRALWAVSSSLSQEPKDQLALILSHPTDPAFLSGPSLSAVFNRWNSCPRFVVRSSSVCEAPWAEFEESFKEFLLPLFDSCWDSVKPQPGLAMLNPDFSNWSFWLFKVQVFSFKAP